MQENKKAFVTGHPIKHSRSPMVHGYWLDKYNIAGTYEKIDTPPDALCEFVKQLKDQGFSGGNFTIPHKEQLFDLVDEVQDEALKIGAINTIWFEDDKLIATNTDAYGFATNLDQTNQLWSYKAEEKTAIVLGAGGASRAIVYALLQRGFKEILLANRTVVKAEAIAAEFATNIRPISLDEINKYTHETSLFINTTSLGMNDTDELPLDLSKLNQKALVTDIVYTPLETPLLKQAKLNGNQIVDGLGMLLHQAVPGFEKWFGQKPEVTNELHKLILADIERPAENTAGTK